MYRSVPLVVPYGEGANRGPPCLRARTHRAAGGLDFSPATSGGVVRSAVAQAVGPESCGQRRGPTNVGRDPWAGAASVTKVPACRTAQGSRRSPATLCPSPSRTSWLSRAASSVAFHAPDRTRRPPEAAIARRPAGGPFNLRSSGNAARRSFFSPEWMVWSGPLLRSGVVHLISFQQAGQSPHSALLIQITLCNMAL
jgi:hypothetical protein